MECGSRAVAAAVLRAGRVSHGMEYGRATSRLTVAIQVAYILCVLCASVVKKVATWVKMTSRSYVLQQVPVRTYLEIYAALEVTGA
ncbi:MAG: hypothetical protein KatS3mg056_3246 [Chloroflexus sp.]|nr:MAG: hypothetical protein KatS3mg056_3246 [Chloroflexus sp.]